LLIGIYLLFFNKKDLNNGIDWFIPYAMNANEISPKANPRLMRIQKVSKIVRAILVTGLIIQALAFVIGVVRLSLNIPISPSLEVKSHAAFNNCSGFILFPLKNCSDLLFLPLAFMVTLNFFRFFSRLKDGHLFEAQTIKHLENAGKWWIGLGLIQIVLQSFEAYIFSPSDITISGDGVVAGIIVFLSPGCSAKLKNFKRNRN
jgi:hypothetical protein